MRPRAMIHSSESRRALNTAVRSFAESGPDFKKGIIYVLIHLLHRTRSKQVRALSGLLYYILGVQSVRQPMIIIALINFAASVIFLASENFWSCCLMLSLAELQPAISLCWLSLTTAMYPKFMVWHVWTSYLAASPFNQVPTVVCAMPWFDTRQGLKSKNNAS